MKSTIWIPIWNWLNLAWINNNKIVGQENYLLAKTLRQSIIRTEKASFQSRIDKPSHSFSMAKTSNHSKPPISTWLKSWSLITTTKAEDSRIGSLCQSTIPRPVRNSQTQTGSFRSACSLALEASTRLSPIYLQSSHLDAAHLMAQSHNNNKITPRKKWWKIWSKGMKSILMSSTWMACSLMS